MATGKFIAYYSVSTQKQGSSGLGLEAQQAAVSDYLNGGTWRLLRQFMEIESGRKTLERPRLAEALRLCEDTGATLLIAKLDRLARNVASISGLIESEVEFVAVDMPEANKLTIHVMAEQAEQRWQTLSERNKDALAEAKARGVKLGGCRTTPARHAAISRMAREARTRKRQAWERPHRLMIAEIRASGARTLREIAEELNRRGVVTRWGVAWTPTQVHRLLRNA